MKAANEGQKKIVPSSVRVMDLIATAVRSLGSRAFSERQILGQVLPRLSAARLKELRSDACYYYESREGPYDYLIEQALFFGVLVWDWDTGCYRIGPNGRKFGVYVKKPVKVNSHD